MADYLRNNQPVVINFENTDNDVRKRIVDFISGTIYALDGSLRKVGRNIMVCAPQNVEIDVENTNYTSESEAELWEEINPKMPFFGGGGVEGRLKRNGLWEVCLF